MSAQELDNEEMDRLDKFQMLKSGGYGIEFFNFELLIAYTDLGSFFCKSLSELNILQEVAKKQIEKRDHVLDRYESWEIPDSDTGKISRLLMSRARNREEKELVKRYMAIATKENT